MTIHRLTITLALIATVSLAGLPRAMAVSVDENGWHAHSHSHDGDEHVHWHQHAPAAPTDEESSDSTRIIDTGEHHDASQHVGNGPIRIVTPRLRANDAHQCGEILPLPAGGLTVVWPPPETTACRRSPPDVRPADTFFHIQTVVLVI